MEPPLPVLQRDKKAQCLQVKLLVGNGVFHNNSMHVNC